MLKMQKKNKAKILEYNKVKKAEIVENKWIIHLQNGNKKFKNFQIFLKKNIKLVFNILTFKLMIRN